MVAPQLEAASSELRSKVRVAKIDSDKNPQWAGKHSVGGLPTIMVFQNGELQQRIEGALMKDQLLQFVEPYSK